jgi:hypothetical protein
MRKSRYQKGSVKKQNGRYVGMWWQDGGRKSLTLGLVKNMTKFEARAKVDKIVAALQEKQQGDREWLFGDFVRETYIPFYSRRWKPSTRGTTVNRVLVHLVREMEGREMKTLKRDDLQALLDSKAENGLSYAMVDHLRWDIRQIFEMAADEGLIVRNPANLLCTPRDAVKAEKRVMTVPDVQSCFSVLDLRERLIV